MGNILRKQNKMMGFSALTADQIPYGSGSVEDKLDVLDSLANRKLDYAHAESITSLPYTATKDGVAFITVGKVASPDVALRDFSVNGAYVASAMCYKVAGSSNYFYSTATIPLFAGDVLTSNFGVYGTYNFVPYSGPAIPDAESEGF